jgi:glycine dehydrogenase subunit 1
MICDLTDMYVSNASHYDGATATAEAAMMSVESTRRKRILISGAINPEVLSVVKTYCEFKGIRIDTIPVKNGYTSLEAAKELMSNDLDTDNNKDIASIIIQSPNYYGLFEEVEDYEVLIHEVKGLMILNMNPLAMSIYKSPGSLHADIAIGDGQVLGNAMNFGGPSLGFMATTKKLMRKLPGRIVGKTVDADGKEAYVLTMCTREQQIRREKATSNICTAQALLAVMASMYAVYHGPDGVKDIANTIHHHTFVLANNLKAIGYELANDTFFDT